MNPAVHMKHMPEDEQRRQHACDALHYPELCLDILEGVARPVALPCGLTERPVVRAG